MTDEKAKDYKDQAIRDLPNLGPKSEAMLADAGITRVETVFELGALETYLRVKRGGTNPSLNLLWALQGAVDGCHWTALSDDLRGSLLMAVDAHDDQRSVHPSPAITVTTPSLPPNADDEPVGDNRPK